MEEYKEYPFNKKEKEFLEKNIKNYKELPYDGLIEKLEEYMQTKTRFNKQDEKFMLVEKLIDDLVDYEDMANLYRW